ncbi:hypothetical protein [Virgibacillus necropolis]|uniref:hypothetical protein n=1 Tax=Virgibacillus necropolis TaxID=163877 RepID=UPI0013747B91|nr:hypothetical protein [Virgibacillus necropolis]
MKTITQVNRTVYSTEELTELIAAVEQQGGNITRTTSLRNGAGISVEIELNENTRQI